MLVLTSLFWRQAGHLMAFWWNWKKGVAWNHDGGGSAALRPEDRGGGHLGRFLHGSRVSLHRLPWSPWNGWHMLRL